MKFSLTALGVALSFGAVATAASGRDVFDRASKIKGAVLEKRAPGKPFSNSNLEKRASPYLNDASKSTYHGPRMSNRLLTSARIRC